MNIILKNIPASTLNSHIKEFIRPAIAGSFFSRKGTLENILIYKYSFAPPHASEYFAVVDIEPESVAKRVIERMNRKLLHGKRVEISEYHDRHWSNDRRKVGVQVDHSISGRRKGDRRRKHIDVEVTPPGSGRDHDVF